MGRVDRDYSIKRVWESIICDQLGANDYPWKSINLGRFIEILSALEQTTEKGGKMAQHSGISG